MNQFAWRRFYILATVLLFAGCEQTFEPFKENDDFIFSMAGFLDSGEEIQHVRVINLQQEDVRNNIPFEGDVYFRDVLNNEVIQMDGELIRYSPLRSAYSFSTNYPLQDNRNYVIIAEREDGAESRVNLRTPSDFRDPVYEEGDFLTPDGLRIWDVPKLAEVSLRFRVTFPVSGTIENRKVVLTGQARRVGTDQYLVPVSDEVLLNAVSDLDDIGEVEITNCEFLVAKGGPNYRDFSGLSDNEITIPNSFSNVSNGTGFITTIKSKRALYPSSVCADQND